MLANLVCSLIQRQQIVTTVAKAMAARSVAEKMVTLGKNGTLHHRRLAAARLRAPQRKMFRRTKGKQGRHWREQWSQNNDVVRILFEEIAPQFKDRQGGYTRVIKLAKPRQGDASPRAILQWVEKIGSAGSIEVEGAPAEQQAEPAGEKPAEEEVEPADQKSESGQADLSSDEDKEKTK